MTKPIYVVEVHYPKPQGAAIDTINKMTPVRQGIIVTSHHAYRRAKETRPEDHVIHSYDGKLTEDQLSGFMPSEPAHVMVTGEFMGNHLEALAVMMRHAPNATYHLVRQELYQMNPRDERPKPVTTNPLPVYQIMLSTKGIDTNEVTLEGHETLDTFVEVMRK